MINYRFNDNNNNTWYRVNKTTARRLFDNGLEVCLCPSNLRPFGYIYSAGIITSKARLIEIDEKPDFEKLVNQFYYYNCVNSETGRRVSYYVKEV